MATADQILNTSMKQICDGSITLERFQIIQQQKENFLAFCALVIRKSHDPKEKPLGNDDRLITLHLEEALSARKTEVETLEKKKRLLMTFFHHCKTLPQGLGK